MPKIKWWFTFAGYTLCCLIGTALVYALFPFRMAQIEFGSMADWGVKNMKRMVAYLPVLAVLALFPAFALAGDETRLYGPQGQYLGRSTTNSANPSQQSIYDASGRYLGRAMTKPDGSVKVYDAGGRFQGSTLPNRQPKTKYKKGRVIPALFAYRGPPVQVLARPALPRLTLAFRIQQSPSVVNWLLTVLPPSAIRWRTARGRHDTSRHFAGISAGREPDRSRGRV